MMRTAPLPPDQQYFLDGAEEYGEVTSAAGLAIRLYGQSAVLDQILEDGTWRGLHSRRRRAAAVEEYGLGLIRNLPEPRRSALIVFGVASVCRKIVEIADVLCEWNFEDSTKGGCLLPFRKRWALDARMKPTPRVRRRLYSPKAIRRYCERNDEAIMQRERFAGLVGVPIRGSVDEAAQEAIFDDLREIERQGRAAAREAFLGAKTLRVEQRRTRRSVKRAAALAVAVLGSQTVSAFARGEAIVLPGAEVSISAQRRGSISASGHGALSVAVLNTTGDRLANLCVYQEAPALDQLVSLALFTSSGRESAILDAGNLFAITDAAVAHPALSGRIKKPQSATLDLIGFPGERSPFRQRIDEYREATLHIYLDAIGRQVLGRAYAQHHCVLNQFRRSN